MVLQNVSAGTSNESCTAHSKASALPWRWVLMAAWPATLQAAGEAPQGGRALPMLSLALPPLPWASATAAAANPVAAASSGAPWLNGPPLHPLWDACLFAGLAAVQRMAPAQLLAL